MYHIRTATQLDTLLFPTIERSAGSVFRDHPTLSWIAADTVMSLPEHCRCLQNGLGLVAVDDTEMVVGFLVAECIEDWLHVWQMAVDSDLQTRGIGTALLAELVAKARVCRIPMITLTTFRDIPWNAPFYERHGFRRLKADALSGWLKSVLDSEASKGLPKASRCAMCLTIPC